MVTSETHKLSLQEQIAFRSIHSVVTWFDWRSKTPVISRWMMQIQIPCAHHHFSTDLQCSSCLDSIQVYTEPTLSQGRASISDAAPALRQRWITSRASSDPTFRSGGSICLSAATQNTYTKNCLYPGLIYRGLHTIVACRPAVNKAHTSSD